MLSNHIAPNLMNENFEHCGYILLEYTNVYFVSIYWKACNYLQNTLGYIPHDMPIQNVTP
jgi:hypothetical protein